MMEAPEAMSYSYENHSPKRVKTEENNPDKSIILKRVCDNFSAMYTGMVSKAMTKMSPTTFMATTTVRAESTKMSV